MRAIGRLARRAAVALVGDGHDRSGYTVTDSAWPAAGGTDLSAEQLADELDETFAAYSEPARASLRREATG